MITVCAIGRADEPDDVVSRAPRRTNSPNTGLSTPAENVCNHCRFGACRHTEMNRAVRPGQASPLKNATCTRARSASSTVSSPRRVTTCSCGAAVRKSSAYRSQAVSVQNSTSGSVPATGRWLRTP